VAHDDRLRIAVFIDFDNIEIGVKNTLGSSFDAGIVLEALKERGEVVAKTAYSDWQRAGGYSRMLTQHAIKMVQRNLTPGGDKNGADINLALDALEMAFTHPHINAFVIVGGDSDFISLVEKLKQYDKKVFIVGGRKFTSAILQRNCHEFLAYENLVPASAPAPGGHAGGRRPSGRETPGERAPIDQVIPLVTRALKVLSDREVSPQLGLLKSTLLQLDSTFSERTYGAGSFRDFAQKLERAGVLSVQQGKGGWIVGPAEAAQAQERSATTVDRAANGAVEEDVRAAAPAASSGSAGTHADGVRELKLAITSAAEHRWPIYLRHVKQMLRQSNPSFDERAYGFANLTDLIRAAQKDGWLRVDRDRQGGVRIFRGASWPTPGELGVDAAVTSSMIESVVEEASSSDKGVAPQAESAIPETTPSEAEAADANEPLTTPQPRRRRAAAAPSRGRGRSTKAR
jgi:uncharacterized LabA/DUF88 family protein